MASFFVSRVDSEIDKRLEKIGTDEALALRGKAGVANSRLAYADHGEQHGDAVTGTGAQAQEVFDALTAVGIDLTDVFLVLENEGVDKFEKSWAELLETVKGQLDGAKG